MKAILVRKGLWEVVSGTPTRLLGSPNAKTVRAWQHHNVEAIAELQLNTESDQLLHLTGDDAACLRTLLQEVHASPSLSSRIVLHTKFYQQHMMDASQAVQAYVAQVCKSAFRLEQAGATISNEERLGVLLAGLPFHFGPFIVSLEALPESDRTFVGVVWCLVNEDARLSPSLSNASAFTANVSQDGVSARCPVAEITRFNCGRKGHCCATCPLPPTPTVYQEGANLAAALEHHHGF